jgi:hypothetical protein
MIRGKPFARVFCKRTAVFVALLDCAMVLQARGPVQGQQRHSCWAVNATPVSLVGPAGLRGAGGNARLRAGYGWRSFG